MKEYRSAWSIWTGFWVSQKKRMNWNPARSSIQNSRPLDHQARSNSVQCDSGERCSVDVCVHQSFAATPFREAAGAGNRRAVLQRGECTPGQGEDEAVTCAVCCAAESWDAAGGSGCHGGSLSRSWVLYDQATKFHIPYRSFRGLICMMETWNVTCYDQWSFHGDTTTMTEN